MYKLLKNLPSDAKYSTVKAAGEAIVKQLKAWDEEMIQRKSTAYDDVENFPNKFTADYMFMVNQNESDIPRVNQPVLDLLKELPEVEANAESINTFLMTLTSIIIRIQEIKPMFESQIDK